MDGRQTAQFRSGRHNGACMGFYTGVEWRGFGAQPDLSGLAYPGAGQGE